MNRRISIGTIVILTASFVLFSSCKNGEAKRELKTQVSTIAPALVVFTLEKELMSSSLRIPGELEPYQQVDLYAKLNSFVKKLYVDVGSEVSAGQLLAILEAPEINSQLSAAAARLKMQEAVYIGSKATYDRLLETSKTPGTISPQDLEQAYAKQQSDKASMETAKAQYSEIVDARNYLQVRAPFHGVITARNVSSGAYVGPSGRGSEQPMFTLQEQKKLRLVVSVPEIHTGYLSINNEVKFTVRSQNDSFIAKLSRQAGALDNRLRSERIEMDVLNTNKKLLPGMIAEVTIPLKGNQQNFVVPTTAILNSTLGVFVIKVQDKKTVWVPITIGKSNNGRTEVFGNLVLKDTLVKTATEEVRDGGDVGEVKF